MDKIWDRNPAKSGVIDRCGGDEKTNNHVEPIKVETLNKYKHCISNFLSDQTSVE